MHAHEPVAARPVDDRDHRLADLGQTRALGGDVDDVVGAVILEGIDDRNVVARFRDLAPAWHADTTLIAGLAAPGGIEHGAVELEMPRSATATTVASQLLA